MTLPTCLEFNYVNWKGERHNYLVKPKELEFGNYGFDRPGWIMKAEVLTRDGEPRRNVRSFLLIKIEDAKEVSVES